MKYILLFVLLGCAKQTPPEITPGFCDKTYFNAKAESYTVSVNSNSTYFNTLINTFPSELSTCIPTPHHLPEKTDVRLYTVTLNNILPNDILIANFVAEVTCEMTIGSLVDWYVQIEDSSGMLIYRTPTHGENISLEEHHKVIREDLDYKFTVAGNYKITVIAFGATGNFDYQISNAHLVIEEHYGTLEGFVLRQ